MQQRRLQVEGYGPDTSARVYRFDSRRFECLMQSCEVLLPGRRY